MEQIPAFNILFVGKQPSRIIPIIDHLLPRGPDGNRSADGRIVQFEHNGQSHSVRLCPIGFEGLENTEEFSIDRTVWQKAQIVVYVYSAGNQRSLDKIQNGFYPDCMSKKSRKRETVCFLLETHADGQDENAAAVQAVKNDALKFVNDAEGLHHHLECTITDQQSMEQAWRLLAELHHQH